MTCCRITWPLIVVGLSVFLFTACEKSPKTNDVSAAKSVSSNDSKQEEPVKSVHELTGGKVVKPSSTKPATHNAQDGEPLLLTGITMATPTGWLRQDVTPGLMKPVAVFKLPAASGDATSGSARFTYFPNMKGMDQANIDRWIGQVRQPNGQPSTREQAKLEVIDLGSVRITMVDILGTVDSSMGKGGTGANQRLIAAIIDHPRGPHFVRIYGGVATMDKWHSSIMDFFGSAKVR